MERFCLYIRKYAKKHKKYKLRDCVVMEFSLFRPNLALLLQPPDWLCVDEMKKLVLAEGSTNAFARVPRFYLEIAHMFVQYAKEDLPDSDTVSLLDS